MRSFRRTFSATLSILIGIFALTHSERSNAYSFVPEAQEWSSWAAYCKARYVTTDAGKRSPFANEMAPQAVDYWRTTVGHDAFLHIHHYCAGVIWLDRAYRGWQERPRQFLLRQAIEEARYTYERIPADNPMATIVASTLAQALLQNNDTSKAEALVKELIERRPDASEPYVAAAIVYHRVGRSETALMLLERGQKRVEKPSAEFYYTFGLILANLDRYSEAAHYADLAYGLGYPLPGLRQILERHDTEKLD